MLHFPDSASLQGLGLGLLLTLVILIVDKLITKLPFTKVVARWQAVYAVLLICLLQSIGLVWYLALIIGVVLFLLITAIINRLVARFSSTK